jgi:hypothetical protein
MAKDNMGNNMDTQIVMMTLILRHLKGIVSALEKYLEQTKNAETV